MPWPKGKPRPNAFQKKADSVAEPESVEAAETASAVPEPEVAPVEAAEPVQPQQLGPEALGQLADALIGNPVTSEAFRLVSDEIIKQWEETKPADTAAREVLYHELQALKVFRAKLGRISSVGKAAAKSRLRIA